MAYTVFDASVGVAKDVLASISAILAKAEASSVAASVPAARLHPDMLPFTFQVYTVAGTVNKMIARITGVAPKDPPEYDREMTFATMKALVADAQAQVDKVDRDTVNSRATETVNVGMGKDKPDAPMQTWQYVHGYAVPNLYFHLATAYGIARKEGVELGKRDFLEPFLAQFVTPTSS